MSDAATKEVDTRSPYASRHDKLSVIHRKVDALGRGTGASKVKKSKDTDAVQTRSDLAIFDKVSGPKKKQASTKRKAASKKTATKKAPAKKAPAKKAATTQKNARCAAKTAAGKRCKNSSRDRSKYCGSHKGYRA